MSSCKCSPHAPKSIQSPSYLVPDCFSTLFCAVIFHSHNITQRVHTCGLTREEKENIE